MPRYVQVNLRVPAELIERADFLASGVYFRSRAHVV